MELAVWAVVAFCAKLAVCETEELREDDAQEAETWEPPEPPFIAYEAVNAKLALLAYDAERELEIDCPCKTNNSCCACAV